jgi:hypothetical protein
MSGAVEILTRVKSVANSNIFPRALSHEGAFSRARHAHYKEESIRGFGTSDASKSGKVLGVIRHTFGWEIDLCHDNMKLWAVRGGSECVWTKLQRKALQRIICSSKR